MAAALLKDWTVDYGDGPRPCVVPHAWRQDVDVRWEGPAVYRTEVKVPDEPSRLVFHGVSYEARVFIDDEVLGEHRGIWDAFSFDLAGFSGKKAELRVEVVKNGGARFPVRDVLSGFLPYVFNTFGGIYKDVEIVVSEADPPASDLRVRGAWSNPPRSEGGHSPPIPRVTVKGARLFVDGKPFYLRAPLSWGWYPELGHANPPEETIRREVTLAKGMGFNAMKFCLWVPPHRYFDILNEEGMFAWLELPLWDPTPDPEKQEAMLAEMERITRQVARHDNIIVWTCGCELSDNTTAEFRERLYRMVKEITGCPLVKDNSGGSEMYGGDLREFGDFYDFHPYCDLPFYPQVLDSLLIGPRKEMPILLGEFNDVDVFRDLARLKRERPYWTSSDPYLNDQGARWEPPVLPSVLETRSEVSKNPELGNRAAIANSVIKAHHIRKLVQEWVRSRADFAGYVVTGWRDTPISSAGFLDDWGNVRDDSSGCPISIWTREWNDSLGFFLIPFRRPPWVHGGNRPGWIDPQNHHLGPVRIQLGVHSDRKRSGILRWNIHWHEPDTENRSCFFLRQVAAGEAKISARPGEPAAILSIDWTPSVARDHYLEVEMDGHRQSWRLNVFPQPDFETFSRFRVSDPMGLLASIPFGEGPGSCHTRLTDAAVSEMTNGARVLALAAESSTVPAPFWREAAYEFCLDGHELTAQANEPPTGPKMTVGTSLSWLSNNWTALLAVSPDRVIDLDALFSLLPKKSEIKVLINRIDTRTFKETPIMVMVRCGKGRMLATTLRPYGGLGCQPTGVMNNPAGAALLENMMRYLEEE